MKPDNSLADGVYFNLEHYAGFFRRMFAILVDLAVVIIAGFVLLFTLAALTPETEYRLDRLLYAWIAICWLYLSVLKPTSLSTLGYRLLGIKIVTTKGEKPSFLRMTFRLLLWFLGPINFAIDLIWLGIDSERQTLRDCFSGTYVVRRNAEPLGTAPTRLSRYCAAGMTLVYPRVVRPRTNAKNGV